MPIHHVNVPSDTITSLLEAKPATVPLLDFEAAILRRWVARWQDATPHKRQKMIDGLLAPGEPHAIRD